MCSKRSLAWAGATLLFAALTAHAQPSGLHVLGVKNPNLPCANCDTKNALGAPDSLTCSLGVGGSIDLQLGVPILDGLGPDLAIWEGDCFVSGNAPDETADVFISFNGVDWKSVGGVDRSAASQLIDIAGKGLSGARYVRIVDTGRAADPAAPGFDLDAITIIASQDCNANGTPDFQDVAGSASRDCNANGIPDECDLVAPPPIIYWTDVTNEEFALKRAAVGGSPQTILRGLSHPRGAAIDLVHKKIYWADPGSLSIRRANLDGSDAQTIASARNGSAYVAVDPVNSKVYWTDSHDPGFVDSKIRRVNMDGANPVDVVATGLTHPASIALDIPRGKLYWSDGNRGKVQRANLDGSNIEDILTGLDKPYGMAADFNAGFLYIAVADRIQRANLDGGGLRDLFTGVGTSVLTLDSAAGKLYWPNGGSIERANLDGSKREIAIRNAGNPCGVAVLHPPAYSNDCNGNTIPDECELEGHDCNRNAILDSCEIADGTETDCDGDGVPDACELANRDCNANGLLDSCDIASGASRDCNNNAVPDDCEGAQTIKLYDLAADWSDTVNPNGPWSYREGRNPLPHVDNFDPATFTGPQPAWSRSETGQDRLPVWHRSRKLEKHISDTEVDAGDVACHSADDRNGIGNGVANVAWACPADGIVDIRSAAWMGRDIGRRNTVALYLNDKQLTSGMLYSGDPWSRFRPFDLAKGSGGPAALRGIRVKSGDEIRLEVAKASGAGDFVGVQLQIVHRTPGNNDCNANGNLDACDVTGGSSKDCNRDGVPDECQKDLDRNGNGILDSCEP
ncbi:MAG: hypothetical protein HZA51_12225 [Planctomycetes bacterium]|nr:hypothetical protein [Planctomycetota bacterium]